MTTGKPILENPEKQALPGSSSVFRKIASLCRSLSKHFAASRTSVKARPRTLRKSIPSTTAVAIPTTHQ